MEKHWAVGRKRAAVQRRSFVAILARDEHCSDFPHPGLQRRLPATTYKTLAWYYFIYVVCSKCSLFLQKQERMRRGARCWYETNLMKNGGLWCLTSTQMLILKLSIILWCAWCKCSPFNGDSIGAIEAFSLIIHWMNNGRCISRCSLKADVHESFFGCFPSLWQVRWRWNGSSRRRRQWCAARRRLNDFIRCFQSNTQTLLYLLLALALP